MTISKSSNEFNFLTIHVMLVTVCDDCSYSLWGNSVRRHVIIGYLQSFLKAQLRGKDRHGHFMRS